MGEYYYLYFIYIIIYIKYNIYILQVMVIVSITKCNCVTAYKRNRVDGVGESVNFNLSRKIGGKFPNSLRKPGNYSYLCSGKIKMIV